MKIWQNGSFKVEEEAVVNIRGRRLPGAVPQLPLSAREVNL